MTTYRTIEIDGSQVIAALAGEFLARHVGPR